MAKTKISEWSATPASNTDIDGINIAEGCAPSGINDAIREMMAQVKDLYSGTTGDAIAIAGGGTGATTASAARTALGVAIGTDVLPVANPSYTGTLTGGTGVVNFGSGQFYKDASGNVGIGTSSPGHKLDVVGAGVFKLDGSGSTTPLILRNNNTASTQLVKLGFDSNGAIKASINAAVYGNDYMTFNVGSDTERARIDSSGNFLVGTTGANPGAASVNGQLAIMFSNTGSQGGIVVSINSGAGTLQQFTNTAFGQVGSITTNSTSTAYNTSSDYRLKHDIAPMTGALAKVVALNPVTYKWNHDDSAGEGFIAHELQEVCPDAVTGEKDAVNEDGSIKHQGIDTSFLVATLTAAIQEQQAIITALTARVASLEASNTPVCVALTPEATEPVVMTVEVKP